MNAQRILEMFEDMENPENVIEIWHDGKVIKTYKDATSAYEDYYKKVYKSVPIVYIYLIKPHGSQHDIKVQTGDENEKIMTMAVCKDYKTANDLVTKLSQKYHTKTPVNL